MSLVDVLVGVGASTVVLTSLSVIGIVGVSRVWAFRDIYRERISRVFPYVGILGLILLLNGQLREIGNQYSLDYAFNITGNIYAIEGNFVAWVQSFHELPFGPLLTKYFSFIYIYGYVYLLVFPFLAYLLMDEGDSIRRLMTAYGLNYTIGLTCYMLFVAFGPRNFLYPMVDSLLYTNWPQSQLLTSEVNTNTNVFPSLHSSLAVTVGLFSVRTRETYPRWVPIAVLVAVSVCVSTMYLGIHWGTDVVAGILLAVFSVRASDVLVPWFGRRFPPGPVAYRRVRARAAGLVDRFRS